MCCSKRVLLANGGAFAITPAAALIIRAHTTPTHHTHHHHHSGTCTTMLLPVTCLCLHRHTATTSTIMGQRPYSNIKRRAHFACLLRVCRRLQHHVHGCPYKHSCLIPPIPIHRLTWYVFEI